MFARSSIILAMAMQNILLHRIKSSVVGGILFFGSLFLCTALSLTRSVEASMAESIQGSLAGDFQVYDSRARDKLALFGGAFFGREELGSIPDWKKAAETIMTHPGIAAVVPMGFEGGFIGRGNDFDGLFDKLRDYIRSARDVTEVTEVDDLSGAVIAQKSAGQNAPTIQGLDEHISIIKQNLMVLRSDLENELALLDDQELTNKRIATVDAALVPSFWSPFESAMVTDRGVLEDGLTFLETQVAPIAGDKPPVYLRYMGTDLGLFSDSFSRFALTQGEIPDNQVPWILLPERFYETELKILVAVLFDKIEEAMREQKLDPDSNPQLAANIRQLKDQVLPLVIAVPPQQRTAIGLRLAEYLKVSPSTPFEELTRTLLTVDANNALGHADWFQEHIAPVARLYDVALGETLYLRAYTRTGFLRTIPLRVAGIFSFQGLSRSDIAGQTSIIDLGSYRELYGVMSATGRAELEELTQSVAVAGARIATDSASLEDSLFGDPQAPTADQTSQIQGETEIAPAAETPDALAINLAIVLKDRSAAAKIQPELEKILREQQPNLQLVDWKEASGLIGQLVTALRAVLVISVVVIMIVGAAIINNSLMMSTLERTREIGTLRAIGATRTDVTGLFLAEIAALAALAVYAGALAAVALNYWLNQIGIPAGSDFVVFLFSGPRLYPSVYPLDHFAAATALLAIAVISSAFPARIASRIEPAVAMQEKE